ncbi:MAG: hypothetical protein COA88_05665 [Kordia sp.]|nr:MAG: hypothetical protein COA88_05665 [Kordia sp.]
MSKKVLFVVPDGTGIKNYLFSDIIQFLIDKNTELTICHSLPNNAILEIEKLHGIKLNQLNLSVYKEPKSLKFYREAISYARLHYNTRLVNNETILTNWNTNHKGAKKVFYKLISFYGKQLSKNYKNILKAEEYYRKLLQKNLSKEIELLNEIKPDVVFCTHQRSLKALPIIAAAKKLNIKTIGAIYSWDNLPKARLTVQTDEYVVWSEYMKSEMKLYYPELKNTSIHVTGTPQFEFYSNEKNSKSKAAFFKEYNLDLKKKTICFSGDDEKTSPFDPKYLEDLASVICANDEENYYQIIFRRCPVDLSDRYDFVLEKYKKLIKPIIPLWSNNEESWTQIYPLVADIKLLTNICKHSDLVINIGSTMAHDFTCLGKPSAYINYDAVKGTDWSVKTIYQFQHFRSMTNKKAVYWINSKDEILATVEKGFVGVNEESATWLNKIAAHRNDASKNIVEYLLK